MRTKADDEIHAEARAELAKLFGTPEQQDEWLRGAFLSDYWTIAKLRERNTELQKLALLLMPHSHALTVREAQMLNCCRVCRLHPVGVPTMLNYGEEFACTACVQPQSHQPSPSLKEPNERTSLDDL